MVQVSITAVALQAAALVEGAGVQAGRKLEAARRRLIRWLDTGNAELGQVIRDIRRLRRAMA